MKSDRLVALDGLRGIAALTVLLYHISISTDFRWAFREAYIAVDFFFILSGFVIGSAYEKRLAAGELTLRRYARIRFARLWPCITLGAGLGAAAIVINHQFYDSFALSVALQLLCLPLVSPGGFFFPLNGPMWSLFYEMVANALHAAFARVIGSAALVCIVAASGAGLGYAAFTSGGEGVNLGWGESTAVGGLLRVMFSFFMGVALSRLHRLGRLPALSTPYWICVLVLIIALAVVIPSDLKAARDMVVVCLGFPLVLTLAVSAKAPPLWLPPARFLGAISYPLYATHFPVRQILGTWLPEAPSTIGPDGWARWAAYGFLAIGLAWLISRFVERPAQTILLARSRSAHAPA